MNPTNRANPPLTGQSEFRRSANANKQSSRAAKGLALHAAKSASLVRVSRDRKQKSTSPARRREEINMAARARRGAEGEIE